MRRRRHLYSRTIGAMSIAAAAAAAAFGATAATGPSAIDAALKNLSAADPAARETAMRTIAAQRPAAAGPVVDLLNRDDVATRGAAMELLERWGAPTADLDPWNRATLSPEKLAALRAWAAGPATRPANRAATLPASIVADELNVLLSAPTPAAARIVRERLAVAGESALPAVYERLRAATADESRRRLTALRYRLVASNARAAAWPDGFDRLTDADNRMRRAALAELTSSAAATDSRLLLELFGDDDALVREGALNALRTLGGPEATRSLVQLLNDPSPNVRAAVLKALAADHKPPESLASAMAAYVKREADADLLSPALSLLGKMPGSAAAAALCGMLDHGEWRVRAAAVDAIAQQLSDNEQAQMATVRPMLLAAVLKHLEDPEPFVVSRVMLALSTNAQPSDLDALAKAADRRPDLLPDLITSMTRHGSSAAPTALPYLRRWAKDPRPAVRAGALKLLLGTLPTDPDGLNLALDDADPAVRAVGIAGVAAALDELRPQSDTVETSGFFGFGRSIKHIDLAAWAADFRSGKTRPKWLEPIAARGTTVTDNLPDSAAGDAALMMAAFGQTDRAKALMRQALNAPDRSNHFDDVARALFWLPPTDQGEMLTALLKAAKDEQRQSLMLSLTRLHLPGLTAALWQTLADPAISPPELAAARQGIRDMYLSTISENSVQQTANRKALNDYIESGTVAQKAVALWCMTMTDPNAASKTVEQMLVNAKTEPSLRRDLVQLRLLSVQPAVGAPIALAALDDPNLRDLAVRYLAGGSAALSEESVKTHLGGDGSFGYSNGDKPEPLGAPAGVKADLLRPLATGDDPDVAAYAGYLLVMLDDPTGLEPLKKVWEQNKERAYSPYHRLLYRAITKRNDDSLTPLLANIYDITKPFEMNVPELYQTIQPLTGPAAVELRKRIAKDMAAQRNGSQLQRRSSW